MPTKKQIQANRLNAQKSTGPRSAEGKAVCSQNALKSGIHAESQIIRGEDPADLDALIRQYFQDFQPQSASERALMDILIDSEWTLRRLRKAESQLWNQQFSEMDDWQRTWNNRHPDEPLTGEFLQGRACNRAHEVFARLERRRESLQRVYHRTLQQLRQIQSSRPPASPQPDKPAAQPPVESPASPSSLKPNPNIGSVPHYPKTFDPANPVPSPYYSLTREIIKLAEERKKELPKNAPHPHNDAA